ncbi:MAG: hypothetical protein U1C50_02710 [Patescibacteria group bacterium]|nr:hypothetical protein [Patescibacteria group bacterium]
MLNKLVLLSAFILSLFLVSPVQAKVITKEKGTVTVAAGEVINDDLFIGAESVDIAGTINGDIYIGAGTVNFSGRVSGDLVVGAGTVTIDKAFIGDSLIVGAGTVIIDEQSRIGGSLLAGVGTLDNQARVGRNFMVGAGKVKLDAPVGGEARVGSGSLSLGPKTLITGDLTYVMEEDLDQAATAMVKGKVTKHQAPEMKRFENKQWQEQMSKVWRSVRLALQAVSFFGALIVGLVLLWLLGKPTQAISDKIQTKFGASLGWGLVLLFVAPPALLLLMLTGVGAPLAFILGGLLAIDLYLAKLFAAMAMGKVISHNFGWKKLSPQAVFFVGLVVYYLLRLIPLVGFFVGLLACLSGLGGLWLYKKQLLAKK